MLETMGQNVKLGLLLFLLMTVFLLAVLRFTRQNQLIRTKIKYPLLVIFALLGIFDILYIFSQPLPISIEPYYFALLYLSISVLIIRFLTLFFFDFFLVRNKQYKAPRLLKEISSVVLFTVVLVIVIQNTLKIQLTTVLATSALITVVLGLALQETLGNLFAGLALHLDPPYRPGDWIRSGENTGRVEEVTWRATKLRTVNNDYIVIPNGQIAKEKLVNHSFPKTPHATRLSIGVSYDTPPNKMARVVREVLSPIDNVTMDPPPEVRLAAYQDFSINYEIKFFFKDFGIIEPTIAAIKKALWYQLRRNEIEIPFPIRNVYLHANEERIMQREQKLARLTESLRKVYLFASLEDDERRMIAERLVEMRYAEKEMIIREGEQDESFFIIDKGEVEVFLLSAHGNRKILTTLAEGDFFGEMALMTGQRRSANVEAVTDVRVYRLNKETFKEVLETRPEILDEIGGVLCRRKDQLDILIAESSGDHSEHLALNMQEAKSRILSRLRSYFGL